MKAIKNTIKAIAIIFFAAVAVSCSKNESEDVRDIQVSLELSSDTLSVGTPVAVKVEVNKPVVVKLRMVSENNEVRNIPGEVTPDSGNVINWTPSEGELTSGKYVMQAVVEIPESADWFDYFIHYKNVYVK